jgi:hypothetical protein
MEQERNLNEFIYEVSMMIDCINQLPNSTNIQTKRDDGIKIGLYKDPKGRIWWNYKLSGEPWVKQREVST